MKFVVIVVDLKYVLGGLSDYSGMKYKFELFLISEFSKRVVFVCLISF